jgi:hypothetical protein
MMNIECLFLFYFFEVDVFAHLGGSGIVGMGRLAGLLLLLLLLCHLLKVAHLLAHTARYPPNRQGHPYDEFVSEPGKQYPN